MCLLVAVNAKYIHTNLAVRYLRELCHLPVKEYSINDRTDRIAADIYRSGEKSVLFSCYIWNIRMVLDVCGILKKADPTIKTVLGGPEVSFDAASLLQREKQVDFVLTGEGESSLPAFLQAQASGDYSAVPGLVYRTGGKIQENPSASEVPMDSLPFPYRMGELRELAGRLIYYETSRGCPFQCGFCLSSATRGVRFLSIERAKREILFFIREGVPLVKLVDRTFNADNRRALEIVEFIKEHSQTTCFHFEVKAETMSDELIRALSEAKPGLFQLEIGVQSTNRDTLLKIKRGADFERITKVVRRLKENGNIHLHLDLIAGLPGESAEQFEQSFNDVFRLHPQNLQLGFLKKLKGARLDASGSEFQDAPPYEVVRSDAMSYAELLHLKDMEDVLEKYYNSGTFQNTLAYLIGTYAPNRPYNFFAGLAGYFRESVTEQSLSRKSLYEVIHCYAKEVLKDGKAADYIIFDYCLHYKDSLSFMADGGLLKERAFAFLKQKEKVAQYFPQFAEEKPTQLYKQIRFYPICNKIYAFCSTNQTACDVTQDFT